MKRIPDDAVSPVIGILLMLVVTIIIAAVVSGFAGGLAGSQQKEPQVSLSAKYSQTNGLEFTHMGGDSLTTMMIKTVVRPSTQFSRYADKWAEVIPNINITNKDGDIWTEEVNGFIPGDKAYVAADVFTNLQIGHVNSAINDQFINHPSNVGKTIGIELFDSQTNRLIAKTDAIVKA